ncbi:MAG: helix-turn-helix transcriptional regulator [Coriobacteriia bacterium]|nr:helix-turn-helix transcriptional regulator [Coriobacteriia bacterium]
MSTNKYSALLNKRKAHPFLALCLSMVAVGIAAELIYATSGRFSAAGDSVLLMIPVGIVVYGVLEHFFSDFCRTYRSYTPLLLLLYSMGVLAVDKARFSLLMATLFGILIGVFVCTSLVSFLENSAVEHLGLKVGISASLYSVAVFPLSMSYRYFSNLLPKVPITTLGFVILSVLLLVVFFLWLVCSRKSGVTRPLEDAAISPRNLRILLIGLVILIALGQVMNSGSLEKQGGLAGIPWFYFAIIILRVPFAALLGYWIDKRFSVMNMVVPIALMVLGCLAALFLEVSFMGNAMIYLLFNLGEKGCVFLVCILCAMVAVRRPHKGFIAGFGLLIYFASEGLLNLHVLGISQTVFEQRLEFHLTLTIILCALLILIFLFYIATRAQNKQSGESSEADEETLQDVVTKYQLTPRQEEVFKLIVKGMNARRIAQALTIEKGTAQNHIGDVMSKMGTRPRGALAAKYRHLRF